MRTAQAPQPGRLAESPTHAARQREAEVRARSRQRGSATLTARRCDFPRCLETAVTPGRTCTLHENVTVSGSWVDDKHADNGHG